MTYKNTTPARRSNPVMKVVVGGSAADIIKDATGKAEDPSD